MDNSTRKLRLLKCFHLVSLKTIIKMEKQKWEYETNYTKQKVLVRWNGNSIFLWLDNNNFWKENNFKILSKSSSSTKKKWKFSLFIKTPKFYNCSFILSVKNWRAFSPVFSTPLGIMTSAYFFVCRGKYSSR